MSINKKIQVYIENKGLKLVDISKKIGISKQNFSRILKSDDLKVSQLIELCAVLEVSPTYFFDGTETINSEEIEGYKKRITELEILINTNRKAEISRYYNTIQDILKNDYANIDEQTKTKVYEQLNIMLNTFETFEKMNNEIILEVSQMSKLQIKKHVDDTIAEVRARKINSIKNKK